MAEMGAGPGGHEDPEVLRYISREALDRLVDAKVDLAMAEYLGTLDAPAIWEYIKKHDRILLGNGRPGLIEEMAVTKPLVAKFEAHIQRFSEFELATKLANQSIFSRFDTLETKVDDGLAKLTDAIKPFTNFSNVIIKGAVAIGFLAFLVGGTTVFLLGHSGKLKEIVQWLMN